MEKILLTLTKILPISEENGKVYERRLFFELNGFTIPVTDSSFCDKNLLIGNKYITDVEVLFSDFEKVNIDNEFYTNENDNSFVFEESSLKINNYSFIYQEIPARPFDNAHYKLNVTMFILKDIK